MIKCEFHTILLNFSVKLNELGEACLYHVIARIENRGAKATQLTGRGAKATQLTGRGAKATQLTRRGAKATQIV
ncbi:hypothetical protein D7D25_01615 [Proteiniphilum sp. X52]|nr:hypothetical protein D7D25_01615 [Proteiniphilum sp. X52]